MGVLCKLILILVFFMENIPLIGICLYYGKSFWSENKMMFIKQILQDSSFIE